MASRPNFTPTGPRRHQCNPQWRRDRRPRLTTATLAEALAKLPSLPRPLLCRLTERMLERLDELDGDCDLEPDEDRCVAGDDGCAPVYVGGVKMWGYDLDV